MLGQLRTLLSDLLDDRGPGDVAASSLQFRYEDLAAATGYFCPQNRLGAGAAGEVFRGCLRGGTEVAVKVLSEGSGCDTFSAEVAVLSRFRHPNLVILLGWGQHVLEDTKFLVYELMPAGSVGRKLYRCKQGLEPFRWDCRLRVAYNAACGLSYMMNSNPRAFHRDIKVSNILLDYSGVAKVSDFGLAGMTKDVLQSHLSFEDISGTPGYVCPEYVLTGEVTEASEVYSFGTVMLELLTNILPAKAGKNGEILYPIMQAVRPAELGAHGRLMTSLDHRAEWPRPLVEELGALALRCVDGTTAQRPAFADIVVTLRRLSQFACEITSETLQQPVPRAPAPEQHICSSASVGVWEHSCIHEFVCEQVAVARQELFSLRQPYGSTIMPRAAPCEGIRSSPVLSPPPSPHTIWNLASEGIQSPPFLSPPPSPRPSVPPRSARPVDTPPLWAVVQASQANPTTRPPPPPEAPASPPPMGFAALSSADRESFGDDRGHHAAGHMRSFTDYVPRVGGRSRRDSRGAPRGARARQRSAGPRVLHHKEPIALPRADEPMVGDMDSLVCEHAVVCDEIVQRIAPGAKGAGASVGISKGLSRSVSESRLHRLGESRVL